MTPETAVKPLLRLRCADVLPVGCDVSWQSSGSDELVVRARAHGERAHGFTPAWYTKERLSAMARAVT